LSTAKLAMSLATMNNLQWWMAVVTALRAFGVFNAWVTPNRIRSNVYSNSPVQVTPLLTRLFGTWTALSGGICAALVYDPNNLTLLYLGLWSFILALGHFVYECFVTKTSSVKDASIPFVVASVSLVFCAKGILAM